MGIFSKTFLAMYLEDLVFCIKRAGWKVTKIQAHLTFEQKRFEQKFIVNHDKNQIIVLKKIFINK